MRGKGWRCGLCHVESNIVLRSREIQNVCMSCDIKVKTPEVRDWLRGRLGDFEGKNPRTVEPICGEVEQDEPGTA